MKQLLSCIVTRPSHSYCHWQFQAAWPLFHSDHKIRRDTLQKYERAYWANSFGTLFNFSLNGQTICLAGASYRPGIRDINCGVFNIMHNECLGTSGIRIFDNIDRNAYTNNPSGVLKWYGEQQMLVRQQ